MSLKSAVPSVLWLDVDELYKVIQVMSCTKLRSTYVQAVQRDPSEYCFLNCRMLTNGQSEVVRRSNSYNTLT